MIERVVTKDSLCQVSKAILVSRRDVLTVETAELIGDHNNEVWCRCKHMRPEGFDAAICPAV